MSQQNEYIYPKILGVISIILIAISKQEFDR
jgi:hypothetical protein